MESPSAPPGIPVIPFAVALESSTLQGLDEPDVMKRKVSALVGNNGVVGTIIVLQNSIIVWVGWGKVQQQQQQQQQPTLTTNNSASATPSRATVVGKGTFGFSLCEEGIGFLAVCVVRIRRLCRSVLGAYLSGPRFLVIPVVPVSHNALYTLGARYFFLVRLVVIVVDVFCVSGFVS
jgi:hypothetical protein